MPEHTDWELMAASILKAELKRKNTTYGQLADPIGDKEVNIRNKLSRGKFSAAFPIQHFDSIRKNTIRLG